MPVDLAAALLVSQQDRTAGRRERVPIAPLQQRDDRRPEIDSLGRQAVLVADGTLLVGDLLDDAVLEQPLQA